MLLGPYTMEEHAKRLLVVREPRLNHAYKEGACLAEHQDPSKGKKKWVRTLEECGAARKIPAVPLHSVGSKGKGDPSCMRTNGAERPAKRASRDFFSEDAMRPF